MSAVDSIDGKIDRLATLIEERLGVRGRGLENKLRRAGRLLPRRVHRDAARLIEAQRMVGHPKLRMQADTGALDRAYRHCESWLRTIDPADRRKGKILGFLATNAFNMLAVAAMFIAYLVWSGHL